MFESVWAVCLLAGAFIVASAASAQTAAFGYDLNGRPVTRLGDSETRAIVLLFLASDCPISNRYLPEIKRLQSQFAPRGVVFWLVYPDIEETADHLHQHLVAYGGEMHTLLDPKHRLVSIAHAKVTPESAVLVRAEGEQKGSTLTTAYHGRIDNRYVEIGRERPAATEHDLEQAISAVLEHRSPNPPGGPAVGCGITGLP